MELINKTHPAIGKINIETSTFVTMFDKGIRFSAASVDEFGIFAGLHMHFLQDDDRLYFYVNSDTDGFPLTQIDGERVVLNSTPLIRLLGKKLNVDPQLRYMVRQTSNKLKGDHLLEIDFTKTV